MALEQIKTQVLLLHSQQSTLDALSAMFGDRYAVHVATSGTEALTTLGETPIHVIVSAQELPGMSGLEALREAKKRSPDTIGILLAGEDGDDGLEALVGDQEVFQIVRGAVTPEALLELVESATKRIRLLAISESANDLAANVDEPAGEHIVMETSENGANIISDGTARLRALRARQPRIASNAGGSDVDVLVLTKDEEFLATIMESSQELHKVHHANTPAQAEAIAREHKVGVLVTDAAMVASEIESITLRLRKDLPRLVAIVAGRRDDGELLMDLINRGRVYRFLLKPVSPGRARLAIEASVKHHLEAADASFTNKRRPATAAPRQTWRPATVAARRIAGGSNAEQATKSGVAVRVEPSMGAAPGADATKTPPTDAAVTPASGDAGDKGNAGRADPAGDSADDTLGLSGRFRRTITGLSETLGADAETEPAKSGLKPALLAGGGAAVLLIGGLAWWLARPDAAFGPAESDTSAQTPAPRSEPLPSVVESDVPLTEMPSQIGSQVGSEMSAETAERPLDVPVEFPLDAAVPAAEVPAAVPAYQPFLDEARDARDAGEIVAPPGTNAIEMYLAALEIAPEDAFIVAELTEVIDEAIAVAETALLEQRTDDAAGALDVVRLASPDNPRLPFLDAQVVQLQLRAQLDRARVAIREQRFEDAAAALQGAEDLVGAEQPEFASLQQELEAARSEQRVDEVLALANERLAAGSLTNPANDNARYYFELALGNDAENAVARQGLNLVAGRLVLRARDAIDSGALDEADVMLQDASALDPESSEVTAVIESLNAAMAEAEAERLAEAERQAEAEREAELELQASLDQAAGADTAGEGLSAGDSGQLAEPDLERSFAAPGSTTASLNRNRVRPATNSRGQAGGNRTDESGSVEPGAYVPISSLTRTNYVAPRYPRAAQRRNITGSADVSFTVTTRGDVANVEILDSSPGDVFDGAALEAVTQWRFEPPLVDGMPVERRVAVRLAFNLE